MQTGGRLAAQTRLDARLLLPATAGWLTAAGLLGTTWWVCAAVGASGAVVAAPLWRVRRASPWCVTGLAVAVVVAGLAGVAGLHVRAMKAGPVRELAEAEAAVTVRLSIAADPAVRESPGSRRPPYVVVRGVVEEVRGRGQATRLRTPVLVVGSADWAHLRYGSRVEAHGRLRPVESGTDVAAVLSSRSRPRVVDEPAWWLRAAERVRAGLRRSVQGQPEAVRGLVPALAMGDVGGLPAGVAEDFRTTGLTHLSAVSGTNLTLLLAFVVPLARIGGVRARGLTVVGLVTVVAFVVLARPQPSVLRAAVMGLVALAAMTSGSRRRGVRSLSAAVLGLLLLDVSLARSAGFALSVLATAGIVILAPGWRDALARWLPVRLAEAVACPLAAQLACTPVVAWLSGQVSMVAVAANLLAEPAVGPATVLGFAAAGASLIWAQPAAAIGWLAAWPARWILAVAEHGADLPGAAARWPATLAGVAVLTALCALMVAGMRRTLARPAAAGPAVVLLAVVVLRPAGQLGWPPADWVVVACDVGQGDGLVVSVAPGTAVVVDTGPDPAPIDRCLRELGVRSVPVLLITHFHADHAGGLAGVLHGRTVGEIDVTPYPSPPYERRRVQELAAAHGTPVRAVTYGENRTVGAVSWHVVWPARVPRPPAPGAEAANQGTTVNNTSVAMLLDAGGVRVLFTGDLEEESQRAVVASGADLRADVLKVPHHGSSRQDERFLRASGARLALVSVGVDNDYGHPAPSTMELLARLGMTVARTDTAGSVAVVRTVAGLGVATLGTTTCPGKACRGP